jgi:hypothetical protein
VSSDCGACLSTGRWREWHEGACGEKWEGLLWQINSILEPPLPFRLPRCCAPAAGGPSHPLFIPSPPSRLAEFQLAITSAFGTPTLPRAFMAVRRSEWQHFGEASLEQEAALMYARY